MGLSTIINSDEQERNEENRLKGTNTEFIRYGCILY